MLPVHFPPWQMVYWWFRRFVRRLLFRTIHDIELMVNRARAGRAEPSAAILDSQRHGHHPDGHPYRSRALHSCHPFSDSRRVSRGLGIPQGPDGIYPGAALGKRGGQAYGREDRPRDPLS